MSTKQTVIWTALPNGWATDAAAPTVKLSVLVSPRLETTEGLPRPTLAQFPDFLDWASKVKNMTFAVKFASGSAVRVQRKGRELSRSFGRPCSSPRPMWGLTRQTISSTETSGLILWVTCTSS